MKVGILSIGGIFYANQSKWRILLSLAIVKSYKPQTRTTILPLISLHVCSAYRAAGGLKTVRKWFLSLSPDSYCDRASDTMESEKMLPKKYPQTAFRFLGVV